MSECLACLQDLKKIPEARSSEAVAACKRCGSFACNEHGQRNPNIAAFKCVECDVQLLTESAIVGSLRRKRGGGPGGGPGGGDPGGGGPGANQQSDRDVELYETLDEFLQARPAYPPGWFAQGMQRVEGREDRAMRLVGDDPISIRLMMGAIALALMLEIPQLQLSTDIRGLVPVVEHGGPA